MIDAFIVSAVRTPVARTFKGTLSRKAASELINESFEHEVHEGMHEAHEGTFFSFASCPS